MMYSTRELQDIILKLKKENDVCILAHAYQSHDIWEVADYVGDSYGLSQKAAESHAKTILMCGVRFMAETVKILSPDKKVLLSHAQADCPMARQMDAAMVRELKKKYPGYAVAAYINTTAELKTECDVCVTSSAAVKVIRNMDAKDIIFIPDCNLGRWVADQIPKKNLKLFQGGCPIHASITGEDVKKAKSLYPKAQLLVHPECRPEVYMEADYIGSTTGIMDYAKNSSCQEFIIGTENSIVQHLQFLHPDKKFYPLAKTCICHDMKLTTLADVYHCICGNAGEEIVLPEEVMDNARRCLDEMIRLGE